VFNYFEVKTSQFNQLKKGGDYLGRSRDKWRSNTKEPRRRGKSYRQYDWLYLV
jgi:hypothetical protein